MLDNAEVLDRDPIFDDGIHDPDARVNLTGRADLGLSFQMHARMDHRIGTDLHIRIDIRRGRVLDRHAGCHQLFVLLLPHDAAYLRQLGVAVDAKHLVGLFKSDRLDSSLLPSIESDEIG